MSVRSRFPLALYSTISPLILILLLALAVRLSMSWHPGYGFDIGVYESWAESASELGLARSYKEQVNPGGMLPDYPPFSITMFGAFGHVYKLMFGEFDNGSLRYRIYIKTPSMIADLLICWLLYLLMSRWKGKREGLLAALIYALNPAAIYDGAIWGQTDSIYSMFLLAALTAWIFKRNDLSAIMLALSILTKFQAVVLFPMFAILVIRDRRTFLRYTIIGSLTILVVLTPYAIGGVLQNVLEVYTKSIGHYGNATIGAYNFWWSILADKGWRIDSSGSPFGLLSYTKWGLLLFFSLYAFILCIFGRHIRRSNPDALMYCASMICAAFFLFLTQMHERYLFPFVVFGVPLVFLSRKIAAAYIAMTLAFTMNLMGVTPLTFIDKALFREFDALDVFIACTQVWMFVFLMIAAYQMYVLKQRV